MSLRELIEEKLACVERPAEFKPVAWYDQAGDYVEFFKTGESFYAEHIDDLVTIYKSHESDEEVGILLKNVGRFLREFVKNAPGFRSEVRDHRIKAGKLFTARIWSVGESAKDARVLSYLRQFRAVAEEYDLEVDFEHMAELVA